MRVRLEGCSEHNVIRTVHRLQICRSRRGVHTVLNRWVHKLDVNIYSWMGRRTSCAGRSGRLCKNNTELNCKMLYSFQKCSKNGSRKAGWKCKCIISTIRLPAGQKLPKDVGIDRSKLVRQPAQRDGKPSWFKRQSCKNDSRWTVQHDEHKWSKWKLISVNVKVQDGQYVCDETTWGYFERKSKDQ